MSLETIKKLREQTGAGIGDINKALAEAEGNEEKAIEILRKAGQSKAAKKADRETNEGLIKAKISQDKKRGTLVAIACETDFVARNADFQEFVSAMTVEIDANGETNVQSRLAEAVGKIGENIQLKKTATLEIENGLIDSYIHANGKVGVLVSLSADKAEAVAKEEFQTLAHEIALQIAATDPAYLLPSEVPAENLDKEKEIYAEQLKNEGKPAEMIEKIVLGKINKYYTEVCLLKQPYIKDDKKSIEQLITETAKVLDAQIEVKEFIRFAL